MLNAGRPDGISRSPRRGPSAPSRTLKKFSISRRDAQEKKRGTTTPSARNDRDHDKKPSLRSTSSSKTFRDRKNQFLIFKRLHVLGLGSDDVRSSFGAHVALLVDVRVFFAKKKCTQNKKSRPKTYLLCQLKMRRSQMTLP